MSTESKLHPFEAAGMGHGPYRFNGVFDLAEAMNPDSAANFGNMRGGLKDAPNLKAGMGTCACCGHAIMVICIVEDGAGDLWGVGSDCVLKTEEKALCDKAKIAVAARRKQLNRQKAQAKRLAQQERWNNAPSTDSRALPGETNGAFTIRLRELQNAEWAKQEAARQEWIARHKVVFDALLEALRCGDHFAGAMNEVLTNGPMTERQADCTAKYLYRRGTPEHAALAQTLCTR